MFSRPSLRTILIGVVVILCLLAVLSWRSACTAADKARSEASIAAATGSALDKVTTDTITVREDQKKKEDQVEKINGADQPLPDGFAADLERVRRGER